MSKFMRHHRRRKIFFLLKRFRTVSWWVDELPDWSFPQRRGAGLEAATAAGDLYIRIGIR